MSSWTFNQNTLTIHDLLSLNCIYELWIILKDNSVSINKLILESDLTPGTIYILKKYLPKNIQIRSFDRAYEDLWGKIDTNLPIATGGQVQELKASKLRFLRISSLVGNSVEQDRFWLKVFCDTFRILAIDNIIIILLMFIGTGLAIQFILYRQLLSYGLELRSGDMVSYAGIKMLCPMMATFILTAKSCTALTSVIQSMDSGNEFKIMNLINLPYNRVYVHPIFIACIIAGPILNMIAIVGIIIGAGIGWVMNGHPYQLFISLIKAEFQWNHLVESQIRAALCSTAAGLATAYAGLLPSASFDGMLHAVSTCVTVSSIANIIIQAIISVLWDM